MKNFITLPSKDRLEQIRTKHGLRLILLHGSQVSGMVHDKSDIDIAVLRDPKLSTFNFLELTDDFIEAFDNDRIDLVDLTHADPLLLFAVVSRCRLLSGGPGDFTELERIAFHRYCDYASFLREESEFIQQKLQTYVTP